MTARVRRAALLAVPALGAVLAVAPAAHAIAVCPGVDPAPRTVLDGQGLLESAIVDARGRLYYTDTTAKELRRLDAPGARPETIAGPIEAPGGLAIDERGRILVGQGDGIVPATIGNLAPTAQLLRVDPETKVVETFASGLQMANGVVRADDGTVFASSDVGVGVDRVTPDGAVTVRWATVTSSNGLAIDRAQRWLYAAQTFQPAQISRISLADPTVVETYATPSPDGIASGPDGMTIDGRDRLIVAANSGGEIWRVDADRTICAVGTGLTTPSAVAYGHGDRGFSAGRLFAVTFGGVIAEIPGGAVSGADLPPVPADVPVAAPAATARDRVLFSPANAIVRGGVARFTARVTLVRGATGRRVALARRLRLPGGRVVRTGRRVAVRVPSSARSLSVRFTVRGVVRARSIRLVRVRSAAATSG